MHIVVFCSPGKDISQIASECQDDFLRYSLAEDPLCTCHGTSPSPFRLICNTYFRSNFKEELDNIWVK